MAPRVPEGSRPGIAPATVKLPSRMSPLLESLRPDRRAVARQAGRLPTSASSLMRRHLIAAESMPGRYRADTARTWRYGDVDGEGDADGLADDGLGEGLADGLPLLPVPPVAACCAWSSAFFIFAMSSP